MVLLRSIRNTHSIFNAECNYLAGTLRLTINFSSLTSYQKLNASLVINVQIMKFCFCINRRFPVALISKDEIALCLGLL